MISFLIPSSLAGLPQSSRTESKVGAGVHGDQERRWWQIKKRPIKCAVWRDYSHKLFSIKSIASTSGEKLFSHFVASSFFFLQRGTQITHHIWLGTTRALIEPAQQSKIFDAFIVQLNHDCYFGMPPLFFSPLIHSFNSPIHHILIRGAKHESRIKMSSSHWWCVVHCSIATTWNVWRMLWLQWAKIAFHSHHLSRRSWARWASSHEVIEKAFEERSQQCSTWDEKWISILTTLDTI